MRELYVVKADGTQSAVKINDPLISNGDVVAFSWSPSGDHIAYLADQDVD